MNLLYYTRYALHSLRRGGQRTLLAAICIAFGVMSLVAMQSLSTLFTELLVSNARTAFGGDLLLRWPEEGLPANRIAQLDQLRAAGSLKAYTLKSPEMNYVLKVPGQVYVLGDIQGIDPATYPLMGEFKLRDTTESLNNLLATTGSAILTRDVADQLNLKTGDTFSLTNLNGAPVTLHLAGIAIDSPDSRGDSLYYSLDTARLVTRRSDVITRIVAMLGPQGNPIPQLEADGWSVISAAAIGENTSSAAPLFDFMFKGAGILGLIIGGIGVANTLQVMLARRQEEIAILKALGYQQRDLLALLGIETSLLGIGGSLLGALAAVGLSAALVGLLAQTVSLLVVWTVNPLLIAAGMAAGIATTMVFGMYAIVRASAVRPATLLRNLSTKPTPGAVLQSIGLVLLLVAVFAVICSLIMESVVEGLEVVGGALAGLIVMSLLFGCILFVVVRVPLPGLRLLNLARRSLKRQQMRAVYALIALFAGIFTISFSANVITDASTRFLANDLPLEGDNLVLFAPAADLDHAVNELDKQGLTALRVRYETSVVTYSGDTALSDLTMLQGRDIDPDDLTLTGAAWGSVPDGVYVPQASQEKIPAGSLLTVSAASGQSQVLQVVGSYGVKAGSNRGNITQQSEPGGLLVSKAMALRLGGALTTVTVIGAVPVDQLAAVSESLNRALPNATVVGMNIVNDNWQRRYRNLFTLAVGVAGLALVAGAILIANSVSLAMVEHRREMGVLKAIGYNSRHVLQMILFEQGALGLLGGLIGMIATAIAIALINNAQPTAQLSFHLGQAVIMIGVACGIALSSAILVAWRPAHNRPLAVLRSE
jgi:putative ABC transport system permease protein